MVSIYFAIVSCLCWAIGDTINVYTARKLDAFNFMAWGIAVSFFLCLLYAPFALDQISLMTPETILLNAFLGFFFILGDYAFAKGLCIANPSLVGTIASSFVIVAALLSLTFLGESISLWQAGAIITVIAGIILSGIEFETLQKKYVFNKGVMYALLAMISWGIYFAFIKIPVHQIGWFWPNFITFSLFPFIFLFAKIKKIPIHSPNKNGGFPYLVSGMALIVLAELTYNYGIIDGLVAIVAPISGSYPVLFVLLASYLFKEAIQKQQIVGIILSLVGIVSLGVLSV